MKRYEQKILGPLIKQLIHSDKHAWEQLKQEFYDGGHSHTAFGFYSLRITKGLNKLSGESMGRLSDEYLKRFGDAVSGEELQRYYSGLICEEIMRRADIASRRM